jgi:TolA-binding protein
VRHVMFGNRIIRVCFETVQSMHMLRSLLWAGFICVMTSSAVSAAEPPNRLYQCRISNKAQYTRLAFTMERAPKHSMALLPGDRVLLTIQATSGASFKKFRSYSDSRISDVVFHDRGGRLKIIFSLKKKEIGFRIIDSIVPNVLVVDVGESLLRIGASSMPADRERIWSGAGKLIHDFDPPLKSELPFFPTPGIVLKKLLSPADAKIFFRGEEALYRERGAEAEGVFTSFLDRDPKMRAIAAYRLGESQYLLQKYESALKWFREGEKLWPDYLVQSPSIVFSYADSLARCKESENGRRMLERLIVGMANSKYGPVLLVRLADIMARGGREKDAEAIYLTVKENFLSNRGSFLASARLADRRFFTVTGDTYKSLSDEYLRIQSSTSDASLKDEALFKSALLDALYGPVAAATASVTEYEKKFPSGIFANVARTMHEDLLLSLYQELDRSGDCRGLVRLVLENRGYLARCTADKGFIPKIADCFRKLGMLREELNLFSSLVESEWAGENSSFLYSRIIEDAWAVEDYGLAEAAARVFIARFPGHENAGQVRERLGMIRYRKKDMQTVYTILSPLLSSKSGARYNESYYYLGKACELRNDAPRAEKSMELFLAGMRGKEGSVLVADARMVIAAAKLEKKDLDGALAVYRKGYETAPDEQREMFLYKMGDVMRTQGRMTDARSLWERVAREGKDPFWRKLALQALENSP